MNTLDTLATSVNNPRTTVSHSPIHQHQDTARRQHDTLRLQSRQPATASKRSAVPDSAAMGTTGQALDTLPQMGGRDTVSLPHPSPRPHTHPSVPTGYGTALPYALGRDNWAQGCILVSFLLLVVLLVWSRKHLIVQAKHFFVPSNNDGNKAALKARSETYQPLLMTLVLCISNGLLLYAYLLQAYPLTQTDYIPSSIMAACIGAFVAYQLLRWLLYGFINWIFFCQATRREWNKGYGFLLTLESLLLFPLVLAALNLGWDVQQVGIYLLIAYALIRLLLLYHSFRIFFPKAYGFLHLIAYLCTLELVPLLIIGKTLVVLSEYLVVKQ